MPQNDAVPSEYPKVNTFTAASARRLSTEKLTFPEMYPHEVAGFFGSDISKGLSLKQVKRQRAVYGDNAMTESIPVGFLESIKRQLKNLVSVFLAFSSLLFFAFGGGREYLFMTAALAAITLLNGILESRAGKVFDKSLRASSPTAAVIRDGRVFVTTSRSLVPGDIIALETDDVVPADARLIECMSLTVLETPVSGRAAAAPKDARFLAGSGEDTVYENMVYAGTVVTGGSATAVVCATGKNSLISRKNKKDRLSTLPKYLQSVQKSGRILAFGAVAAEIILLLSGLARGVKLTETFILSLAVGAATLTDTTFALSSFALSKSVSDAMKRGSIYRNLDSFDRVAEIDTVMCGKSTAFPPRDTILESFYDCVSISPFTRQSKQRSKDIIRALLLCSAVKEKLKDTTAAAKAKSKQKRPKATTGEIYEGSAYTLALLKAASQAGFSYDEFKKDFYRIETEYDSSGEMCRVLGLLDGKSCVILRGSPENVIARCAGYRKEGKNYRLDEKSKSRLLGEALEMTKTQIPIAVALGYTSADTLRDIAAEKKLVFLGFAGFYTSMKIDAASAVFKCEQAGIETLAFSGDSYYTALNMAKNTGIIADESEICTSEILRETEEGLFIANCDKYRLFVNLTDDEWLYILRLKKQNKKNIAVSVSQISQAKLVREADAAFVASKGAMDALTSACDVKLIDGGFDTVVESIKQAKLATKRISDTVGYMTAGFFILFFWALFSVLIFGSLPFGVKDVLLFGMIINSIFGFSLAFAPAFSPDNRKILAEKGYEVTPASVSKSFLNSLLYSVASAAICLFSGFVSGAGTPKAKSSSLLAYFILIALFALMGGGAGGPKKSGLALLNRFCRNYNFTIALSFSAGITALALSVPRFSRIFGYFPISPADSLPPILISVTFFAVIQFAMMFINIRLKTKKKEKQL